ncbi:BID domain-containing T4SS effector [Bartonella rattaustraliani]|uniref:BID domain-containing T4SS effector n=1 Tax=Bartonella rattaustraliani TaxID=481139 RepID=UPI0002F14C0A|nr:BID domain-containing T4SS effector [Bartonella rattaustraliani]
MKKTRTSPSVQELRKLFEQSAVATPPSPPRPTKMTPPKQLREKDTEQSQAPLQQSAAQSTKASPPTPPREKNRDLSQTPLQQSATQDTKASPPTPPRAKDREPNQTPLQQSAKASPPRPPRARDRDLSQTPLQQSATQGTKTSSPTPPSVKDNEQTTTSAFTQEDKELYAVSRKQLRTNSKKHRRSEAQEGEPLYAVPQKQLRAKSKRHRRSENLEDSSLYATATPSSPHTREKLSSILQRNFLLEAYKDEIRHWCYFTYKDRLVLEKEVEEIQRDPERGDELLSQITQKPQSVAKLAGKNILGVKTDARKEAEKSLSPLCAALHGYTNIIRQMRSIDWAAKTKQKPQRRVSDEGKGAESLQKMLHPEEKRTSLSSKDMNKDPFVQHSKKEVQYWCKAVFGDKHILDNRLEDIQKVPGMGEELAWQVTYHPTFFSHLAGRKTLGVKNAARKYAEASLPCLKSAIEDYTDTVQRKKEYLQQQQSSAKQLQKQQTTMESPQLSERSPENVRHESGETSLQRENTPPELPPRKTRTIKTVALVH